MSEPTIDFSGWTVRPQGDLSLEDAGAELVRILSEIYPEPVEVVTDYLERFLPAEETQERVAAVLEDEIDWTSYPLFEEHELRAFRTTGQAFLSFLVSTAGASCSVRRCLAQDGLPPDEVESYTDSLERHRIVTIFAAQGLSAILTLMQYTDRRGIDQLMRDL